MNVDREFMLAASGSVTTYQNNDVQFMYPENWKLIENHSDGTIQVSLQSPNSCVWDLFVFEDRNAVDSVESFVDLLRDQYEEFESDPMERQFGDHKLQGYEANFYCLDLLISAQIVELPSSTGDRRIVMFQGESREFDENEKVFEAITISAI